MYARCIPDWAQTSCGVKDWFIMEEELPAVYLAGSVDHAEEGWLVGRALTRGASSPLAITIIEFDFKKKELNEKGIKFFFRVLTS